MTIEGFSDRTVDFVSDSAAQTSASQHVTPSMRDTRLFRPALLADRLQMAPGQPARGTASSYSLERTTDGLKCMPHVARGSNVNGLQSGRSRPFDIFKQVIEEHD